MNTSSARVQTLKCAKTLLLLYVHVKIISNYDWILFVILWTSANLLTSHWMDKYLHVQSLTNANFCKFLDITLNGQIFATSKSCQCESLDITLNGQIFATSKSCQYKFLDITLNGRIFATPKSCQCKSLDIALNGQIFTTSKSCQCKSLDIALNGQIFATSTNLLTSPWMDQYWHVLSLVNANLLSHFEWTNVCTFKVLSMQTSAISWHHFERTNICTFKVSSMQISTDLLHHIEWTNIGTSKVLSMQTSTNLLTSLWMDQYLHVQSLVNTNLHRSLDVTLNGQIFTTSESCRCKSLDITLSGQIFATSKSCQCKLLQISWHHVEWTNICNFKVSSMQTSTNLLTSLWMDQYLHVQSLVNANLHRFLDITLNGQMFATSKSC